MRKLGAKTRRQWLDALLQSGYLLMLIILPFDSLWLMGQWLRFGNLYVNEEVLLITSIIRNVAGFIMFYILSYRTLIKSINQKALMNVVWFLIFYIPFFAFAQDPSYTDWVWAIRFNYGTERILESFIVGHIIGKLSIFMVYRTLWQP